MNYYLFLLPLFIAFIITSLALICLIIFARKRKIVDNRDGIRHIHSRGISRFGGIAIIIAFIATLILDKHLVLTPQLVGVMLAAVAILIFGVFDDIKQLDWKCQLFFQFAIVSLVYIMGVKLQYISSPFGGVFFFNKGLAFFLGLFISITWVVFLMNVMNWVDGVDGVSGGITLIAAATIFLLSLRPEVNQPPIGIITAALIGSLAAFLVMNFYPAKIMAGTSGSMFMGFILAIIAIFAGAKIVTTLMVLAVPIIDALWVMRERITFNKSIFLADRRHLHYRLLEIGWSPKEIFLSYCAITVLIAVLALNMRAIGKAATLTVICVILASALAAISKKVRLQGNKRYDTLGQDLDSSCPL